MPIYRKIRLLADNGKHDAAMALLNRFQPHMLHSEYNALLAYITNA